MTPRHPAPARMPNVAELEPHEAAAWLVAMAIAANNAALQSANDEAGPTLQRFNAKSTDSAVGTLT